MDNLTPEQRRRNMQNVRSVGTNPELLIASKLRKHKLYFRQHVKNLIGKPDFVFRKKHVAVFVDSDFWHGHPTRFKMPKSNKQYWFKKILMNVKRDKLVNRELRKNGWTVVRVWEHQIKEDIDHCVEKILFRLKN